MVTGVILINSNSIEAFKGAGVKVVNRDGEITNSLIVSDNQFSSYGTSDQSIGVMLDERIFSVSITGNHLVITIYYTGYGISVQSVQHATISGNSMSNVTNDGITVNDQSKDVVLDPTRSKSSAEKTL